MAQEPISMQAARGARAKIYQAAVRLFAENGGGAVTVSELAEAAGIARGTIYNNITEPENLFGEVAGFLAREMLSRTEATMESFVDPVERIATGLRLFVRRAHEDQDWGRFLVRFMLSHSALRDMMRGPPARDISQAIAAGRFRIADEQVAAFVTTLTGTTIAAMNAVICGDQTWRDAGSNAAELILRAASLPAPQARRISRRELPPLASTVEDKISQRKRRSA